MNGGEMQLLRDLVESEWLDVVAMPVQNNRSVLLDIVFSTEKGRIAVSGKAHSLSDGSEAFSLDIYLHRPNGWWTQSEDGTGAWVPRNIKGELEIGPSKLLLSPPREVRFFTDPRMSERVHPKGNFLDDCSGIEILKVVDEEIARMVLVASGHYPCAVEFGVDPTTWTSLLSGLVQM